MALQVASEAEVGGGGGVERRKGIAEATRGWEL